MSCELCDMIEERIFITRKYHEDGIIVIVDCETCAIPMVVFKHHSEITEREEQHAMTVVDEMFEYGHIRKEGRRVLYHEHWHLSGGKLK